MSIMTFLFGPIPSWEERERRRRVKAWNDDAIVRLTVLTGMMADPYISEQERWDLEEQRLAICRERSPS
jgi:hypothetical protein